MSEHDTHHHHHPHVTGRPGELLDLFMRVIDRSTDRDPYWWYEYGLRVLTRFTVGLFPRDPEQMGREDSMAAVREVLQSAIDAGVGEDFLLQALRRDIDEIVRNIEDPSAFNAHADSMRKTMEEVITNPAARARWREVRSRRQPEYAEKTDDEIIAEARDTIANGLTTRHVSADDALDRWTDAAEWWDVSTHLLPDVVFDHWRSLNIQRAIDEQEGRPTD